MSLDVFLFLSWHSGRGWGRGERFSCTCCLVEFTSLLCPVLGVNELFIFYVGVCFPVAVGLFVYFIISVFCQILLLLLSANCHFLGICYSMFT